MQFVVRRAWKVRVHTLDLLYGSTRCLVGGMCNYPGHGGLKNLRHPQEAFLAFAAQSYEEASCI
eukprot:2169505-Amphidinium_carterae.1